jgi:hypothetical protein
MLDYRERAKQTSRDPAASGVATATIHATQPPTYTSLAAQYGLDDMEFGEAEDADMPSLELEYQTYVSSVPSKPGTDMLKYWEVGNHLTSG